MTQHPSKRPLKSSLKAWLLAIALALPILAFAEGEKVNVNLLCTGSGSATETETTYVNERTKSGDEKSKSFGTVQSKVAKNFNGTAYIEIVEPFARIRPPNAMVPTLSSSDEGWFDIKNLKITDTEISGVVKFNVLNKPKLRIDRITGTLTLDGPYSSFSGECKQYDPETAPRAF